MGKDIFTSIISLSGDIELNDQKIPYVKISHKTDLFIK